MLAKVQIGLNDNTLFFKPVRTSYEALAGNRRMAKYLPLFIALLYLKPKLYVAHAIGLELFNFSCMQRRPFCAGVNLGANPRRAKIRQPRPFAPADKYKTLSRPHSSKRPVFSPGGNLTVINADLSKNFFRMLTRRGNGPRVRRHLAVKARRRCGL